jgi:uncharacterized protein
MFKRNITPLLEKTVASFPVTVLTGPRQSGKTTLLKQCFPNYTYLNLESPETLFQVQQDPNSFFQDQTKSWIIDEAQRWPDLFSYIQIMVDHDKKPGQFILSGSQNILLSEKISQSLAGRAAILELLPLSYDDYLSANKDPDIPLWSYLYQGSYPRIYDENLDSALWTQSYIRTYIERDVRALINIKDISTFQLFLKLCAGQHGQLLNISAIAQACGLSQPTISHWLSVLETSYITYRLRPYYKNYKKRLVKTPKFYFYDSGLVCQLLGIDSSDHLQIHSSRGAIFEGWVISECIKYYKSLGKEAPLYFWRDHSGHEIDLIMTRAEHEFAIEIKSGQTLNQSFITPIQEWMAITQASAQNARLIYAGTSTTTIGSIPVISWQAIRTLFDSQKKN